MAGVTPDTVSIPTTTATKGGKVEVLSKGFGFVQFADESVAARAKRKLHGSELNGHVLDVRFS